MVSSKLPPYVRTMMSMTIFRHLLVKDTNEEFCPQRIPRLKTYCSIMTIKEASLSSNRRGHLSRSLMAADRTGEFEMHLIYVLRQPHI